MQDATMAGNAHEVARLVPCHGFSSHRLGHTHNATFDGFQHRPVMRRVLTYGYRGVRVGEHPGLLAQAPQVQGTISRSLAGRAKDVSDDDQPLVPGV